MSEVTFYGGVCGTHGPFSGTVCPVCIALNEIKEGITSTMRKEAEDEVRMRGISRTPPERAYGEFEPKVQSEKEEKSITGGPSEYYMVDVERPTSGGYRYTAECNDIIEALGMNYAEGNAFKAIWRHALARKGKGKPGNTLLYEAEKVEYFGARLVEQAKHKV